MGTNIATTMDGLSPPKCWSARTYDTQFGMHHIGIGYGGPMSYLALPSPLEFDRLH
jgi:hypothetical protein